MNTIIIMFILGQNLGIAIILKANTHTHTQKKYNQQQIGK